MNSRFCARPQFLLIGKCWRPGAARGATVETSGPANGPAQKPAKPLPVVSSTSEPQAAPSPKAAEAKCTPRLLKKGAARK